MVIPVYKELVRKGHNPKVLALTTAAKQMQQEKLPYDTLLDFVTLSHEITKYGKPIAKLVPINEEEKFKTPLFGSLEGLITISGNIIGSTGEQWNAEQ